MRELSLNESLRLFRGLFFLDGLPSNQQYEPIFRIYSDLIINHIGQKLNMSTWLTVIETSRHITGDGLTQLLEYSKKQFKETYKEDVFSTESTSSESYS